jgi:hypothetical protein
MQTFTGTRGIHNINRIYGLLPGVTTLKLQRHVYIVSVPNRSIVIPIGIMDVFLPLTYFVSRLRSLVDVV